MFRPRWARIDWAENQMVSDERMPSTRCALLTILAGNYLCGAHMIGRCETLFPGCESPMTRYLCATLVLIGRFLFLHNYFFFFFHCFDELFLGFSLAHLKCSFYSILYTIRFCIKLNTLNATSQAHMAARNSSRLR